MGGVSGAFLLLPFQMSVLGFTTPSVSATNQLFNVVAIPSGVYRYVREGRMVWPLTWAVVAGTLPGVLLGVIVRVRYLPDPRYFKPFAGVVLLYIGVRLIQALLSRSPVDRNSSEERFRELVQKHRERTEGEPGEELPAVRMTRVDFTRIAYEFYGEHFEVSVWGVAGAALMGTFVTSIAGVAFYQAIAPFYPEMAVAPDWGLGILFGLGGMVGMYFGARCQKYVPARAIKWMLVVVLLFTGIKYVIG
jgi:uncharacterized membrane protein YfcA